MSAPLPSVGLREVPGLAKLAGVHLNDARTAIQREDWPAAAMALRELQAIAHWARVVIEASR